MVLPVSTLFDWSNKDEALFTEIERMIDESIQCARDDGNMPIVVHYGPTGINFRVENKLVDEYKKAGWELAVVIEDNVTFQLRPIQESQIPR